MPLFLVVSIESEVDIKKWASEQYSKHGKEMFKKLAKLSDQGKVMVK